MPQNKIIFFFFLFIISLVQGQNVVVFGTVKESTNGNGLENVEVYLEGKSLLTNTDKNGFFRFSGVPEGMYRLKVFPSDHKPLSSTLEAKGDSVEVNFVLDSLNFSVNVVSIYGLRDGGFGMERMRSVDGMGIYAGKKNEVVRIDGIAANLSTNNSRQIFCKVAGLNIWESDGAGLQLGVGGRGLSPNRTSNFNTRQNGYDISADALGYPESYYSPASEGVEKIEVVRGAASLQYGTQFGGLLNFVMREGPDDKKFQLTTRQGVGAYGFYNSFTSVGGTIKKINYYTYYQFKRGNGWRPNSGFRSHNSFSSLKYRPNGRLELGLEYTYMNYKARQAGGLTDAMFEVDPRQSIRERNWFRVNWNLAALTLDYKISDKTKFNIRNFGLLAQREALGFLGLITRADPMAERDLISGQFRNFGSEARVITKFDFKDNPSAFLAGVRFYKGNASNRQGFGTSGGGADFFFINESNPGLSDYRFPSTNLSLFAENVLNFSPQFYISPGLRYEYISTKSDGYYVVEEKDLAGNIIFSEQVEDNNLSSRNLLLAGLGTGFRHNELLEVYANFSQNYRAINFNDFKIVNPNFKVDPNLKDEKGFNTDLGIRGQLQDYFSYDLSLFLLKYQNRIGVILQVDSTLYNTYRYRTNVGASTNAGIESYVEFDFLKAFCPSSKSLGLSLFANMAYIQARYSRNAENSIAGKKVEFVPDFNIKAGSKFLFKNFYSAVQFTYLSSQFTDATNAVRTAHAVNGLIPSYYVVDLSMGYEWKMLKFEGGVNNLTNNMYFTRRASGYPGPGIIPSDGISPYLNVQFQF